MRSHTYLNKAMQEKEEILNTNLENLKEDLKRKQTVLFLGAGINYSPHKRMMWNDLLEKLLNESISQLLTDNQAIDIIQKAFSESSLKGDNTTNRQLYVKALQNFSVEMKASIIKQLLGDAYISSIQSFLYDNCLASDFEKYYRMYSERGSMEGPFFSLFSVAEIILTHHNIKSVITYNYDTFLTTALNLMNADRKYYRGKKFTPIDIYSIKQKKLLNKNSFPIYHVHGMINPPDEFIPDNDNQVVLTLEEFYQLAHDPYIWQTSLQMESLLLNTCVFIGTQLSDMTMQRILQYANLKEKQENVYLLTAHEPDDLLLQLKNAYHTHCGIKVVYDKLGYEHLYNELKNKN